MHTGPRTDSDLAELQRRLGCEWPAIDKARQGALRTRAELKERLAGVDSADTSVVVYGSLARQEWTCGSDIDWTLLIDGRADREHIRVAHRRQCRDDRDHSRRIHRGRAAARR